MDERRLRVAIAGEGSAHFLLASRLGKAAQVKLGPAGQRWTWVGDGQGGNYLRTTDLAARSKADSGRPRYRRERDQGRPRGFGAVIDAIAQRLAQDADLVVVLFDEDGDPSRRSSVAEALPAPIGPEFVVGWCVPMAEAWLVALVGPQRPERLAWVEGELKRNVARQPESMCAQPASAAHHAKRVLNFLIDVDCDSVKNAKADTPKFLATEGLLDEVDLRAVGGLHGCGLGAFVADLEVALNRPNLPTSSGTDFAH